MTIEITILGPEMEPATWPAISWEEAEEMAEEEMASGDYDHGEAVDTETGVKRYFYREIRVTWEVE